LKPPKPGFQKIEPGGIGHWMVAIHLTHISAIGLGVIENAAIPSGNLT
jgi:hypothetical protein